MRGREEMAIGEHGKPGISARPGWHSAGADESIRPYVSMTTFWLPEPSLILAPPTASS